MIKITQEVYEAYIDHGVTTWDINRVKDVRSLLKDINNENPIIYNLLMDIANESRDSEFNTGMFNGVTMLYQLMKSQDEINQLEKGL